MAETEETLYVLVPCFNEEEGVERTVREILEFAPQLPIAVRVLMIDDGSNDATRRVMARLCDETSQCQMMVNETNLGVGRSVMLAYEEVPSGSWVSVLPGDHEIAFRSLENYVRVRDQYDVILGYLQNPVIRPYFRRLASSAFTRIVSSLYGFQWRYLNGLKMYRVDAFRGIPVVSSGHAFMAELLAKAQLRQPHLRFGEVPFVARGRAKGHSKAIRPSSVFLAVLEVLRGARSVSHYRDRIVRGEGADVTASSDKSAAASLR